MFYQKIMHTKHFLVPLEEKYNCGFGQDFANTVMEKLELGYIVSNVLDTPEGVGFWVNIKKERYWISIILLNAKEFTWEIKISPVGWTFWRFLLIRQTKYGHVLIQSIQEILEGIEKK